MNLNRLLGTLSSMRGNVVKNYVVPGLTSTLLDEGKLRLFEATRPPDFHVTPHSHRFNFSCLVIEGAVSNTLFLEQGANGVGTQYAKYRIGRGSKDLKVNAEDRTGWYQREETLYVAGQWYHMNTRQIHSIRFQQGAKVLFIEGKEKADESLVLLPYVDGKVLETFSVEPWMFEGMPNHA